MIYIFTEDSRDGKELIESVVKILYPDYDIKVDTLQGIYNAVNKLKDKIEQNNIDFNNDYIIVVIDNILENIDIKDLNIFCRQYSNIKLINTQSFEVEILRVDDIEYLGDVSEYNKYFRKLKNITNTTAMTMKVKNDEVYEPLINKAVELKRKKRSRYSDAQILASISIETISKLILNKVFAGNANLKPISGNCWKNNCCIRKSNECILSIIDVEKIQKEEKIKSSNSLYKLQVLMANTIYLSVLKEIDRIIGENISDSLAGKLSDLYKTNVYNAEKISYHKSFIS